MRKLRAWFRRLGGLVHKDRADRELADEIESHLLMHIEDNVRSGMTPEAARRDALVKLGGVESLKEEYRDRRGVPVLEHLIRDLRFGARLLRRSPGFTAVVVLTLGLGVGANTAVFSVVNAVLLRPLPFPESERLVLVWATDTRRGRTEDVASYPTFEGWKTQSRSFESMTAFTTRGMTLSGALSPSVGTALSPQAEDHAELVPAFQATPGFFETLGVLPALGRTFRAEEGEGEAARVAVLSDGLWKRRFAGSPDVLGQTIRANDELHTIVGVMPPDFRFSPGPPEQIYVPLVRDPNRNHGFLRVLGRLRPGVRISAAQAEMNIVAESLGKQYPRSNEGVGANIVPLVDALVGNVRVGLLILLGVVALVLMIACTNVANLLLARSASRQKELAVRATLGAGRRRLMQQFVTEATMLSLAGGALGLLLASLTSRLLVAVLAQSFQIPRIESTSTDGWVLGFAFALSLATGILFGAVFALTTAPPSLDEGLRESSRTATEGIRGRRIRGILIMAETALALVLLAGAGLLLKHLLVMRGTAPGFERENVLAVEFWLPRTKLTRVPERKKFFADLLERTATLPGVRAAALVANLPLGDGEDSLGFHIPGRPDPAPDKTFTAAFNIVSPGYFRTMAIPLGAGREFAEEDSTSTPGVIVINETAARQFWPGEDAVGKQIDLPTAADKSVTLTVVGVTGDVRQRGLASAPKPEMFLSCMQDGPPWAWFALVVRTTPDPMTLAGAIKSVAQSVDRDVPILRMRTLEEVLSSSLAQPRVYALLLGVFAALALVLAVVGLYGVVSYTVTQRTHEVGIRMALGAPRGAILRLVVGQGLGLALAGTAVGLAGTLGVTRLLTHLVPGLDPRDPLTLALVSVLLTGVALAATYLPARRASRVNPVVALRYE